MDLITRNTADTIGLDELKEKIEKKQHIVGYWGTAPTRSPSIGYLIPMLKIRDLIQAGVEMKILLADIHAFLDKGITLIDRTEQRVQYYTFLIKELLKAVGVQDGYQFIRGSSFQLTPEYTMNLLKLLSYISTSQAKKAGSDVVKQDKDPKLSNLVYPLMQAIDEIALKADIELGGLDQRKIFALSRDHIEKLGHSKCTYIMNDLLPSLSKPGAKMSSSDLNGKIEFLDTKSIIADKLKKAYCVEKEVKDNPCMDLAKMIVYPMGGSILGCVDYATLELNWISGMYYAGQLKESLAAEVDRIISPIREAITANISLYNAAFL